MSKNVIPENVHFFGEPNSRESTCYWRSVERTRNYVFSCHNERITCCANFTSVSSVNCKRIQFPSLTSQYCSRALLYGLSTEWYDDTWYSRLVIICLMKTLRLFVHVSEILVLSCEGMRTNSAHSCDWKQVLFLFRLFVTHHFIYHDQFRRDCALEVAFVSFGQFHKFIVIPVYILWNEGIVTQNTTRLFWTPIKFWSVCVSNLFAAHFRVY